MEALETEGIGAGFGKLEDVDDGLTVAELGMYAFADEQEGARV